MKQKPKLVRKRKTVIRCASCDRYAERVGFWILTHDKVLKAYDAAEADKRILQAACDSCQETFDRVVAERDALAKRNQELECLREMMSREIEQANKDYERLRLSSLQTIQDLESKARTSCQMGFSESKDLAAGVKP